jgi:hypothetical protein
MPGGMTTCSVIVRFGEYEIAQIMLAISIPDITGDLDSGGRVTITGHVHGMGGVLGNQVEVFAIPDGRSGDAVKLIGGPFILGGEFTGVIPLGDLNLDPGKHSLTVCAVGQDGDVSALSSEFDVNIIDPAQTEEGESGSIGGIIGGSVGGIVAIALAIVLAVFLVQRSHKRSDDGILESDQGDTKAPV